MSAAGAAPAGLYRIGTPGGLQLAVTDIGAAWLSCRVPLRDGSLREVLLGHATPALYRSESAFMGAIVGRYANRIANGRFTLDGRNHQLPLNDGMHHLHGGPEGFYRRTWSVVDHDLQQIRFGLHSADGDQGYPGALDAVVGYRIDEQDRSIVIRFEAVADAPSPVCLTHHAYFNLDAEQDTVLAHRLRVAASHMLPTDAGMIPTGELQAVAGTPFDLRSAQPVGARLGEGAQQRQAGGYDHCYVLDEAAASGDAVAAELVSSDGRIAMQLSTNYPGLQVYSGNHLPACRGRDGLPFARHAGIALEPQFLPDSPNHPVWREQGCVLRPGDAFDRWMRVSFRVG